MSRKVTFNYDINAGKHHIKYQESKENHRVSVEITCPFCDTKVVAYSWSLAGSGKKCPECGAIHMQYNTSYPSLSKPKS